MLTSDAATWADLGCGAGLFTGALAHLLPPGSTVYAVDKQPVVLRAAPFPPDVHLHPVQQDFIVGELPFHSLDGILMANSLHYVPDKPALLGKLSSCLSPGACFLIVEYDIDKPVPEWVPYPVSFRTLKGLFAGAGFEDVEKLGVRPSAFGRGNLYAALISR